MFAPLPLSYANKAYKQPDKKEVENTPALVVRTPIKKQKGQTYLEATNQWLSTAVLRVRQPIESLFAWIDQKSGIESASQEGQEAEKAGG